MLATSVQTHAVALVPHRSRLGWLRHCLEVEDYVRRRSRHEVGLEETLWLELLSGIRSILLESMFWRFATA